MSDHVATWVRPPFCELLIPFWVPVRPFSAVCIGFGDRGYKSLHRDEQPSGAKGKQVRFRTMFRTIFRMHLLFFCLCVIVFEADAGGGCARPALANQRRDDATIQRLE